MESQNQEFALSGSKNKYTRTDTDFFLQLSVVPTGAVTLVNMISISMNFLRRDSINRNDFLMANGVLQKVP